MPQGATTEQPWCSHRKRYPYDTLMIPFFEAPSELSCTVELSEMHREPGPCVPNGSASLRRARSPLQVRETWAGAKCTKPVSVQNLYSGSSRDPYPNRILSTGDRSVSYLTKIQVLECPTFFRALHGGRRARRPARGAIAVVRGSRWASSRPRRLSSLAC